MRYQVFTGRSGIGEIRSASRIYDALDRLFHEDMGRATHELAPGQSVTICCYEDNPPAKTAEAA